MNWNIPYGVVGSPATKAVDHFSPLSDVVVITPQSPRDAPSPMTVAVREMSAIEKSRLLVQGKQMDLLKSLDTPQRMSVAFSLLIAPLLTAYIAPYHRGCISIGSSPLKQQNIGDVAPKTGQLAFLASMSTLSYQRTYSPLRRLRSQLREMLSSSNPHS